MDKKDMPLFIVFIIVTAVVLLGIGYKMGVAALNARLEDYKSHSLDLSRQYIGVKTTALEYLYSLKQGIFQSGIATVVLRGKIIDIGQSGDVSFHIYLRHVTDAFVNTITPDDYENATIKTVYAPSGRIVPMALNEIKKDDEVELTFTLDFLTAKEKVLSIVVYKSDQ